jgi:hypothetical protein
VPLVQKPKCPLVAVQEAANQRTIRLLERQ